MADIFHRRKMWLVIFGIIHGSLIWNGDILLFYGSLALLALYPLRRVAGSRLVVVGLTLSLLGGTVGIANAFDLTSAWRSAQLQEAARAAQLQGARPSQDAADATRAAVDKRRRELSALPAAIAAGRRSYVKTELDNASGEAAFVSLVFSSGWVFEILGMLIAGMGLFKTGFLTAQLNSRTYVIISVMGYAISLTTVLIGLSHSKAYGFSDAVTTVWMFLPYGLEQIAGMLASASIVLLFVRHRRAILAQRALANVGRMAFSNYILTSLVCQSVFRWSSIGLYGRLEYCQEILVVFAVWFLNVLFSWLWLHSFYFGPLEWIWRSLTYWRLQPFLKARHQSFDGDEILGGHRRSECTQR